jgi:hypothetical protein
MNSPNTDLKIINMNPPNTDLKIININPPNTDLKIININPPNTDPRIILMENHMIILTEDSFRAMLANQVLTATMANAVPNGDTVD